MGDGGASEGEGEGTRRRFPDPIYAEHVLRPAFEDAKRLLLGPMLACNTAHLVMLAETGIVPAVEAGRVLRAVLSVAAEGPEALAYAPRVEDLFFAVEGRLIAEAGAEAGGNLQIARSRNDLDAAMSRLMLREEILRVIGAVLGLRRRLAGLAADHVETLMAGTTHTQPAQPTTLAHYLGGVLGPLERDTERLRALYGRVNRSPLGAAAFTTTGFAIDRELTAALLGFAGVVENGYDAVGASDHFVEATGVLVVAGSSLARFVHDLLIWARPEVGAIRIGDEFVQISSIMPQKRNPVVLEHVRAKIGLVYGDAGAVAAMAHGAAFGDTVDVEDPIYVPLARCLGTAAAVVELLDAVLATVEVDRELLAARADRGFTTSTELADVLVREHGLPFRTAHGIVAAVVGEAAAGGAEAAAISAAMVEAAAMAVAGRRVGISEAAVRAALAADRFVAARSVVGGPSGNEVRRYLAAAKVRLAADDEWLTDERERQAGAARLREARADGLRALAVEGETRA